MISAGWLLITVLTFNSVAPDNAHVRWHFSSLKQSTSEWKLVFTAVIDRGWHLYSQSIEAGGPMPTSFHFNKVDGLKLVGDVAEHGEAKHVFDSTFVMNVVWYEEQVVFTQIVKGEPGKSVAGKIEYSVCSEERCIPGSVSFTIPLTEQ